LKSLTSLKKASVPLKMYLKSLAILEKASIALKKYSKIREIFIKAPHFSTEALYLWKCLQKASTILKISFKSLLSLQEPQKPLKMNLKSIKIFQNVPN
jgi:hypothetical protein